MINTKDKNNYFHSFDDKPAAVYNYGEKYWNKHGKRHRVDKPNYMSMIRWKSWAQEDYRFNNKGPDFSNNIYTGGIDLWLCKYFTHKETALNWQDYNYE